MVKSVKMSFRRAAQMLGTSVRRRKKRRFMLRDDEAEPGLCNLSDFRGELIFAFLDVFVPF